MRALIIWISSPRKKEKPHEEPEAFVSDSIEEKIHTNLRTLLESGDKEARISAAEEIGSIGPVAREAVPDLVYSLGDADRDIREAVMKALKETGYMPADVKNIGPFLIGALKDNDDRIRRAAARALGNAGALAEKALPALMAAQRDTVSAVRQAALEAISKLTGQEI